MNLNLLKENNLHQIDETTLNRIMSKHFTDGFIIISADRHEITDPAERNKRFKNLKTDLINFGYNFVPVWGGYKEEDNVSHEIIDNDEPERALFVPNNKSLSSTPMEDDQLVKLGKMLAEKYQQESFFYKPMGNDYKSYYIKANGEIDAEFTGLTINNMIEQYFTKLFHYKANRKLDFNDPKNKGKTDKADRRFTLTTSKKEPDEIPDEKNIIEIYIHNAPKSQSEEYSRFGEHFFRAKE